MSPADVSTLLLENERLAEGNINLIRYNKILKDQLSQRQDHIQEIQNAKDRLEKRLVECGEFLSKYGICFLTTPFGNFLPQSLKHLQLFFPVSLKKCVLPLPVSLFPSASSLSRTKTPVLSSGMDAIQVQLLPAVHWETELGIRKTRLWGKGKSSGDHWWWNRNGIYDLHYHFTASQLSRLFLKNVATACNVIKDKQNLLPSYLNGFINHFLNKAYQITNSSQQEIVLSSGSYMIWIGLRAKRERGRRTWTWLDGIPLSDA